MTLSYPPVRIRATLDPSLRVDILSAQRLLVPGGADRSRDLPGHARAVSGLTAVGEHLVAIQDDTNSLLVLSPAGEVLRTIPLPAGRDGRRQFDDLRGNKDLKWDLEACVTLSDGAARTLLAFGSGSAPAREHVLRATIAEHAAKADIIPAHALYALLRQRADFAGSELNIEAAVQPGDRLRLFNRGNGAPIGDLQPVNASVDLLLADVLSYLDRPTGSFPPRLLNGCIYDLGELDGCGLSFTDAARVGDKILFSAVAERSPDARRDGPVLGSVLGVIENDSARWTRLIEADGQPVRSKIEGVWAGPTWDDPVFLVTDPDDPREASEFWRVALGGARTT